MDAGSLHAFVEEQLASWEVPGCAVGVVLGDRVVFSAGFGTRRLGEDAPVSPATLFPIGSTTKAFTAAAVGTLVDDGSLSWERLMRDAMPGFAMHDPVATERLTVTDFLCHRSGLPRHEFVWLGHPERTRADIVRRLRYLPLSKDLREAFQYTNLGYIAIGHLIETVTSGTWDDAVAGKLLKPLGMQRTVGSVEEVRRDSDHATPHERRAGSVVEIPFRDLEQAAPAGGLSSCVDDMVSWLSAHVNDGGGVLSKEALTALHAPHVLLPEDQTFPESTRFGYGLGWLVGQYRGRRIVDHSGGVDGFLTECVLLPAERIGIVVLTNRWSPLGPCVAYRAIDELLTLEPIDWPARYRGRLDELERTRTSDRTRVDEAPLPRPVDAYAGDYEHPGYGRFTVAVRDGKLVPRFGTLELSLQHRTLDVFELSWDELADQDIRFPLTFVTAPDGGVAALEVPFEEAVPPIRFERFAHDTKADDRLVGNDEASRGTEP